VPPVAIALVAMAAGYGAGAVLFGSVALGLAGLITTSTIGFMVTAAVVGMGVSMALSSAFGVGKVSIPNLMQDRKQPLQATVQYHQIVYGEVSVSGALVNGVSTGADKEYIHLVVVLAGHPVEAIGEVRINDYVIADDDMDADGNVISGDLAGLCRITKYLGDQTTADPGLQADVAAWTSEHVGFGIAYIVVRLRYDDGKLSGGLNALSAVVKGKKVFDPRSGVTAWSENWALCVRDFLTSEWGMKSTAADIDDAFFIAAANISDEDVVLDADGLTQKRYTVAAAFKRSPDYPRAAVLEMLLKCGAGQMTWIGGKYRLHAGVYEPPSGDPITKSDLAGDISVVTLPKPAEMCNVVQGTFIDREQQWTEQQYPSLRDEDSIATALGERSLDANFEAITDSKRAQRLAWMMLERAKYPLVLEVPVKVSSLRDEVFQTKELIHEDVPSLNGTYRIIAAKYQLVPGGGSSDSSPEPVVRFTLRQEEASVYDWPYDAASEQPAASPTSLINPAALPAPTGLALTPTTAIAADGTTVMGLEVTWTAPAHAFASRVEIQWRTSAVGAVPAGAWSAMEVPSSTTRAVIQPVQDGVALDVRVRSAGGLARSAWTGYVTGAGAADTVPPGPITGASVDGAIGQLVSRWTNPGDSDFYCAEIWEIAEDGSGYEAGPPAGAYQQGETTGSFFVRPLAAGQSRHLWLRPRDRSGNAGAWTYAGHAASRATQTDDIAPGALSGAVGGSVDTTVSLPLDSWVTLHEFTAGSGLYSSTAEVKVLLQSELPLGIVGYDGEGGMPIYGEVAELQVRFLRNSSTLDQIRMASNRGGTAFWAGSVPAGADTYRVQARAASTGATPPYSGSVARSRASVSWFMR